MTEPTKQDLQQAVQDATQAAQEAKQTAQQVAEQIGQAVSQAISKVLQSFTQTTGASTAGTGVFAREELADIGGSESIESDLVNQGRIINANIKRTYDEYQHEGLESIRRSRVFADQIVQNAITHAKDLDSQAIRHHDIAIDRQWNIDEQAYVSDAMISALKPTVETLVAKILADAATATKPAAKAS